MQVIFNLILFNPFLQKSQKGSKKFEDTELEIS